MFSASQILQETLLYSTEIREDRNSIQISVAPDLFGYKIRSHAIEPSPRQLNGFLEIGRYCTLLNAIILQYTIQIPCHPIILFLCYNLFYVFCFCFPQ